MSVVLLERTPRGGGIVQLDHWHPHDTGII